MKADPYIDYAGNLHVHSVYSDGAATVAEIARVAHGAGLDFVIFNDHDYMAKRLPVEEEGFHDDLLVLVGLEIGERFHHYLACNLRQWEPDATLKPQEVIDRVRKQGGFGFLAHPFEKGMPFLERSVAYTWNDLSVKGYTGICIWNFSSRWKERVKTPFHGFLYLLFKTGLLKGPSAKTLCFWDQACQERRVAAVGGSDAHGSFLKWGAIRFTPLTYNYLLNSINVHVLLKKRPPRDLATAKAVVYEAMREGRLYIAHEHLAPARGFRFHYHLDQGGRIEMGQEESLEPGTLVIRTPGQGGKIRLLKDGQVVGEWKGREALYRVSRAGVYRVEVYRRVFLFGWRPWIFSNPIYLRSSG